MVFDAELTDYHLEGEVSGDEESSSDDSDGRKKKQFFGLVTLIRKMKI